MAFLSSTRALLSFWKANDSRFAVAQFSVHHPHSPHLFVTLHQALISPQMFAVQACSSERMHGSAVCFKGPRHHSMPGKIVPGMSELYWVVKLQNGPRVNNPEFWSLKLVSEISIIDTLPLGGGRLIDLPRANQWSFKHSSFILLLEMRRAPPPSLGHRFLPANTAWWACLHHARFLRRARTCSQQSWHSLGQNRCKYRELTRQRESCNRQCAQTMCTFNLSKSKQNKTLLRIQYVADCFSSCPRVLVHRCLCSALVFCMKHQKIHRVADPKGSFLWDCCTMHTDFKMFASLAQLWTVRWPFKHASGFTWVKRLFISD